MGETRQPIYSDELITDADHRISTILKYLADHHDAYVIELSYSGDGGNTYMDSGEIRIEAGEEEETVDLLFFLSGIFVDYTDVYYDLLDALRDELLTEHYPCWERNEGGWGTVSIDLQNADIIIDHNQRYIATDNTSTKLEELKFLYEKEEFQQRRSQMKDMTSRILQEGSENE